MITQRDVFKRSTGFLRRASEVAAFLFFVLLPVFTAQSQDDWPRFSVAYFDCNVSGAKTDNASQLAAVNSASKVILQTLLSDSSSQQVFLLTYGLTDTTAKDLASSGKSLPFPDNGGSPDAWYDFVIAGKMTGNPGSYTLTVSILDGRSYAHVVDGTALFSTATTGDVSTACRAAAQKLLPLTIPMRNWQKALKAANPLLTINPQINLAPAKNIVPLNGSTTVVITVQDCDGLPLANRQLILSRTRGSLSASTVQTDTKGTATVTLEAGKTPGIAIVTAMMPNVVSFARDSGAVTASTSVVLGEADASKLWILEFDMRRSFTSQKDEVISTADKSTWKQKNSFFTQSARGSFIAESQNETNTEFDFRDTTMSIRGVHFKHDFAKESGTDLTGKQCPETSWSMSGSTQTYRAVSDPDNHGEASLDYDPLGISLFAIEIPYVSELMYGYNWSLQGRWNNGKCETETVHQGTGLKFKLGFSGGFAYFGAPPIPELSILPFYTNGVISMYSIFVNGTYAGVASDGSSYYQMTQCMATLKRLTNATTTVNIATAPKQFSLNQNYPNPFNPTTSFEFQVPSLGFVRLSVFDMLGREVARLVDGERAPGKYLARWDASTMPSGVYYCRMTATEKSGAVFTQTRRMALVK
jgi:hypothetical protein